MRCSVTRMASLGRKDCPKLSSANDRLGDGHGACREGPGWPRISPMVPVAVREHFLDDKAQPDKNGTLFPQATQCLMGTHSRSLLCCKSIVVQI